MQLGLTSFKANERKAVRGQALIEFAIILILLVLVVAGGAELAITAYGSSKVSDAAKAGTTEWGQMISHAQNTPRSGTNPPYQTDVGLGDHSVANFSSPSCGDDGAGNLTYDDGIPDDRYLLDKKNQDNYEALDNPAPNNTKSIYLFNPLPIDHESCLGTDDNRGNRSRISILINGYGLMYIDENPNNPNPLYVPGLPKLNQAMYSMYQQVCLAEDSLAKCYAPYLPPDNTPPDERLQFPPGKLCLSIDPDAENCPEDTANLGETGYYFFGASNIALSGSKQYIPSLPPNFRPTFQIECPGGTFEDSDNASNCDTQAVPADICWDNPLTSPTPAPTTACQLKVHVRYRSIFESFITFGMAELPDDQLDNLPYFYNPSKVGDGSNNVKGIAGSEIGPIGATGNPTVKPFKDFRGCYESVISGTSGSMNYQVVSCN